MKVLELAVGEGRVTITRHREGTWPAQLSVMRRLETNGHLKRTGFRDDPASGQVSAVYEVTSLGRRVWHDHLATAVEGERPVPPSRLGLSPSSSGAAGARRAAR